MSHKERKIQTPTGLVPGTSDLAISNSKSKKLGNPPGFPKRPLTAYIRFYKEHWPAYSKMYPSLSNQQLAKVLGEKYRALPEEVKQKYMQAFQEEKQEFQKRVAQFKKNYHTLVWAPQKPEDLKSLPKHFQAYGENTNSHPEPDMSTRVVKFLGEPKKPPMNAYHKFHQDCWSSCELEHLSLRERMVEITRRWQRVPQAQKEKYGQQAELLRRQYHVDLDLWLKTLSPEEYAAYKEATCGKRMRMAAAGGPDPKLRRADPKSSVAQRLQTWSRVQQGLQVPWTQAPETSQGNPQPLQGAVGTVRGEGKEFGRNWPSEMKMIRGEYGSRGAEDTDSSSWSSGEASDVDSI
ncbi:upstream-binding factor 1-like protein 1 [Ctenodactylus gundi]